MKGMFMRQLKHENREQPLICMLWNLVVEVYHRIKSKLPVDTNVINGFLDAFDQLHKLGVCSWRYKPDNALLCNGVVKVGDIDTMYRNETSIN